VAPDLLVAQVAGAGHDVGGPVEDAVEVGDPRDRAVAQVPEEPEHAARPEHACDLVAGRLDVEPVERLGDQHRIGAPVRERQHLGRARERLDAGHRGREGRSHSLIGLDRDHGRAGLDQHLCQLAGAGRQIDHIAPGGRLEQPLNGGRRVAGTGARIAVGDGAEGAGSAVAVLHRLSLPRCSSGTISRMQPTEKIWRNGSFVPWDEANVHILTHALHYGTGVFEGIRAYDTPRGTAVFRLTDHLERLRRSAALYEMDLGHTVPELAEAIHETVAVNNVASCYIRPIVFRGAGPMGLYPRDNPVEIAVAVWPWGAYLGEEALEHGVSCKISSFRRIGPNTLPPTAKASGQYINSVLAKLEASRAGQDEAILLNEEGYIADGSGENVFAVRDGVLHTPPTTASCLPGITRDTVIRIAHTLGYEVREVNLVRTDLYFADEVFLCGTAAEVTPVAAVDGQQIGGRGPITKAVQDTFFAIVSGRDERFSDLLEYPVRAAV
jgi:branched-chain amino acid aminotransferase